MRLQRSLSILASWAAAAALVTSAGPATADEPDGSEPLPGYTDGTPPLAPILIDGAPTRVVQGMHGHASFYLEVPPEWNGELVVWAHGFQGGDRVLRAEPPGFGLREEFLERGYAWTASSYPTTGYDVGPGVASSRELAEYAATELLDRRPSRTYLAGASMGGHVMARSLEEYPRYYDGALSMCGQLGGVRLLDYYIDANLAAQALAGVDAYPAGADYGTVALPLIKKRLGLTDLQAGESPTTVAGRQYQRMVTRLSGGARPGADASLGMYAGVLLSLAPSEPGMGQNLSTRYKPTWPVDINRTVERVHPADWAERNSMDLNSVPQVVGEPRVPFMSLHNIGDLFVPLSMEQSYARKVADKRQSHLLVQRAVRSGLHCDFTEAEARTAWRDLTEWVERRATPGGDAARPAGDAVTDRQAVASAGFGCRFSDASAPPTASRNVFPPCPVKVPAPQR